MTNQTNTAAAATSTLPRETIARLSRKQAERVATTMNKCRTIVGYGATIILGTASEEAFTPLIAEAATELGAARARGYVEAYLDCVETAE